MSEIILKEGSTPSTPAVGLVSLYAKDGGQLYIKDDVGVESPITLGGVWQDWTPTAVGLTTPVYTQQMGRIAIIGKVVIGYYSLRMSSYAAYTGLMRIAPPTGATALSGSGGIYSATAPQVNTKRIGLYLGSIIYSTDDFSTAVSWGASGDTQLSGSFIGEI